MAILSNGLDEIYDSGFRGLELSGDDFGGRVKVKVGATAQRCLNIGHKFAVCFNREAN